MGNELTVGLFVGVLALVLQSFAGGMFSALGAFAGVGLITAAYIAYKYFVGSKNIGSTLPTGLIVGVAAYLVQMFLGSFLAMLGSFALVGATVIGFWGAKQLKIPGMKGGFIKISEGTFRGVIVLAVLLLVASWLGLVAFPGMASTGGGFGTATGTCPDTGKLTLRFTAVESIIPSTNIETGINAQNIGVYTGGSTQPMDTIASVTNAFAASASGKEIPCGAEYNYIFPAASSTSYYNKKYGPFKYSAFSVDHKIVADKVGTMALTAKNSTSTEGQATGMYLSLIGGASDTGIYVKVKDSGGGVISGPLKVSLAYTTANVTSIEVIGGATAPCDAFATVASPSNSTTMLSYQKCYTIPTGDVKNYGETQFNIKVNNAAVCLKYATGQNAACEFVIRVSDLGARVKDGQVIREYANSDSAAADLSVTDATFAVKNGA